MAPVLKDGTYFIINKKATNSAFDLSVQDMKTVIGYNRNKGSNQMWKISKQVDKDQPWTIQSVYNNGYLDVEIPGYHNDGMRLVAIDTKTPMKWGISYDEQNQGWRIFFRGTDSCADLSNGGDPANFTPVVLWVQWPQALNQVWTFESAPC